MALQVAPAQISHSDIMAEFGHPANTQWKISADGAAYINFTASTIIKESDFYGTSNFTGTVIYDINDGTDLIASTNGLDLLVRMKDNSNGSSGVTHDGSFAKTSQAGQDLGIAGNPSGYWTTLREAFQTVYDTDLQVQLTGLDNIVGYTSGVSKISFTFTMLPKDGSSGVIKSRVPGSVLGSGASEVYNIAYSVSEAGGTTPDFFGQPSNPSPPVTIGDFGFRNSSYPAASFLTESNPGAPGYITYTITANSQVRLDTVGTFVNVAGESADFRTTIYNALSNNAGSSAGDLSYRLYIARITMS